MAAQGRRVTLSLEQSNVDSDVFDSFSKQLIPADTLLPQVQERLTNVNASIAKEERHIKAGPIDDS